MARSAGTRRQSRKLGLLRPKSGGLLCAAGAGDGVALKTRCRLAVAVSGKPKRAPARSDLPEHGRGGDFLKCKNHQESRQTRFSQQARDLSLRAHFLCVCDPCAFDIGVWRQHALIS